MAFKYKSAISIAMVILLGIALQVVFVFAEGKDTPNKAAVEFAEAYFKFDPAMKDMLCSELADNQEQDYVGIYIYEGLRRAKDLGYNLNYIKTGLKDISTNTLELDENRATIELKAKSKYALRTFFTGDKFDVHHNLELVKEDGTWKVCGNPFFISGTESVKEIDVEQPEMIQDIEEQEDSDGLEEDGQEEEDSEKFRNIEKAENV
jgi:hypothetical protein